MCRVVMDEAGVGKDGRPACAQSDETLMHTAATICGWPTLKWVAEAK